jgi:2-polyprenyl-3-methyl-5-hydroxy-6-metoxy-1,4-benzoquinol methylase
MVNWDKIYKAFNKKDKNWQDMNDGIVPACFTEGINPLFIEFLTRTNFKNKYVFDIGCGNGKYLSYLSSLDFKTDGIDFSKTSIAMTKEALGEKVGDIRQADMFDMNIAADKYDLIISISTINHGLKKDLQKLINEIYTAIVDGGKAFITIPDKKCLKTWRTFKKHKMLDENTAIPLIGAEKDIPHSFYDKKELEEMFTKFSKLEMQKDKTGQWIMIATK